MTTPREGGPGRWLGTRRRDRAARRPPDRGQATVELALALPIVVVFVLLVVQVALVVRSQILVVQAAREAARQAAVDPRPSAATSAARATPGLAPSRLQVTVGGRGGAGSRVRVQVRYRAPTAVPLVGPLLPDLDLQATAEMRVEQP